MKRGGVRSIVLDTRHGAIHVEVAPIEAELARLAAAMPEVDRADVAIAPDASRHGAAIRARVHLRKSDDRSMRRYADHVAQALRHTGAELLGLDDVPQVEVRVAGTRLTSLAALPRTQPAAEWSGFQPKPFRERRVTPAERRARRVLLHAVLIAGSILFAVPFIWLVSTSCKVPDEMYPPRWTPQIPHQVVESPYIELRSNEHAVRPIKVRPADWERLAEPIRAAITERARALEPELPAFYAPYLTHPELADGLFARILKRAPDELFRKVPAVATDWFAAQVTPERVFEVFDAAYRRAAVSGVVLHGWDVQVEEPTAGDQLPWRAESDNVSLVERRAGLRRPAQEMHYSFANADRFTVQTVLPLEMAPCNLRRVVVSNHADRSWHRIEMTLEMGGRTYASVQSAFAGSDRWQDSAWQFDKIDRIPFELSYDLDAALEAGFWKTVEAGLAKRLADAGAAAQHTADMRAAMPETLADRWARARVAMKARGSAFDSNGPLWQCGAPECAVAPGGGLRLQTSVPGQRGAVEAALVFRPGEGAHVEFFVAGAGYQSQTDVFERAAAGEHAFVLDRVTEDSEIEMRTWLKMADAGPSEFDEDGRIRLSLHYHQARSAAAMLNKYLNNYREVLRMAPLGMYVKNSLLLVVLNIFGQLLGSSLVAFAFARLRWPARDFCFVLVLATLMIPPQVTMIPVFLIFKNLNLYNTLWPLFLPAFFGNAFFIFLMRQFMRGIPADLEDSAKIDGCGYFGIYWRIILPLVKPAMAAIAIFTFMQVWNEFMGPLIYLNDQRLYPLSLGLFALQVFQAGNFGLMMAAAVLMTLPVIFLFFAAQRQFIQGVTLTGLKG